MGPLCQPEPARDAPSDLLLHTLKRNDHGVIGCGLASPVDIGKHGLTCGNALSGPLGVVGDRRSRRDFLRTICGLLGHGESPLARAASNSVRATCSAFSVAAAPTGFAS
jgi:hypothetical protein